ncbi:ATP-binding cassette domain-containing protein [Streptomyces sp. NPDC092296]|uniref:ATP-binding cassette domain-containing protein n=1 Tax=Streptomyces sp. NPDC092296 TaxID=3366012 RepID=UPI0037F70F85
MIEAVGLTKRYGPRTAVADLRFTVRPGTVTGFLGPNGAGKSTTMRLILGLDAPSSGTVTVGGRRYADHPAPLREVGAMLEARSVHTGRSAYHHLAALAATHGIPRRRVEQVIDLVGLGEAAHRRVGGFSLGMGQRLGIAGALLGDPGTLLLDEPVNGLDPEGIRWVRTLLTSLAAEGRTVLVSSHLMGEMALTAEHLIVIGRGRLIADTSVEEFTRRASHRTVRVRTPEAARLGGLLSAAGARVGAGERPDVIEVAGADSERIGRLAARYGLPLVELTPQPASLEEAFMELTRDAVEYQSADRPAPALRPVTALVTAPVVDAVEEVAG